LKGGSREEKKTNLKFGRTDCVEVVENEKGRTMPVRFGDEPLQLLSNGRNGCRGELGAVEMDRICRSKGEASQSLVPGTGQREEGERSMTLIRTS
jgi:hypothetical protein